MLTPTTVSLPNPPDGRFANCTRRGAGRPQ